jgi:hypothetical protein
MVGPQPAALGRRLGSSTDTEAAMSDSSEWSPDEPLGTETFEQGDEDLDEASRLDARTIEQVEQDPALEPSMAVDERELEELGAELDDPEEMVMLDGGVDDPDGLGEPSNRSRARLADWGGWDLDKPVTDDLDTSI